MTVKELCRLTRAKSQTVYYNIKKYESSKLAGHITKTDRGSIELDDFAVTFLTPRKVIVEKAAQNLYDMAKLCDHYKKLYAEQQTRSDNTEQELIKAEERIKVLEFCYKSEEVERKQAEKNLEQTRTELRDVRYDLKQTQQELETVRQEKERAEQQLNEYKISYDDLENDAASKQAMIDRLVSMIKALPDRVKKKYSLFV